MDKCLECGLSFDENSTSDRGRHAREHADRLEGPRLRTYGKPLAHGGGVTFRFIRPDPDIARPTERALLRLGTIANRETGYDFGVLFPREDHLVLGYQDARVVTLAVLGRGAKCGRMTWASLDMALAAVKNGGPQPSVDWGSYDELRWVVTFVWTAPLGPQTWPFMSGPPGFRSGRIAQSSRVSLASSVYRRRASRGDETVPRLLLGNQVGRRSDLNRTGAPADGSTLRDSPSSSPFSSLCRCSVSAFGRSCFPRLFYPASSIGSRVELCVISSRDFRASASAYTG